MPKEMYPIVDKPTIQFIVEEAVAAGITDILIITNRGKGLMEDHFDASPELESLLEKSGKTEFLETVRNISNLANISFIRQKEMKGLGHAVLKAKSFVGNEPFAVMYGDGVITGKVPAIKQLIDHYGEYGEGVVGVKKVDAKDIHIAANNIAITFFAFIVSILFKIGIVSLVYYRAFRACWQAFSKLCKLSSISRKACGVSYAICYMIPKFG